METHVKTPLDIFHLPQNLVVPLFQRAYVWREEEQWQPLWHDLRRMAEFRLAGAAATHFLGAIVIQAQDNPLGHVQKRDVIDGQQRLTTLQLVMDATAACLTEVGLDALSSQLESLTHNQEMFVPRGESRLKLQHTNRDASVFADVMNAPAPVDHAALPTPDSLLVQAHKYFVEQVREWLNEPGDDDALVLRGHALAGVLTGGLQLVVIDLRAEENSQEIFETLNARGTPLTSADLIKNFVFQKLDAEGVDVAEAYRDDWPFESKFWETEVSVGRVTSTRSSVFLGQWLGAQVGEELSPKATFSRFKAYVEHESKSSMHELLRQVKVQAEEYERWTLDAADPDRQLSVTEMAVYRMHSGGVEVLKPILIWLHDPELRRSQQARDAVVRAFESWLVRRMLLRLTSADLGRVVADAIRLFRNTPDADLPGEVTAYLSRLDKASTYWPGDDEIRTALALEKAYQRYPRPRVRMFLEAAEDALRARFGSPRVPRRKYPIEHILPQSWRAGWPVEGVEAELRRIDHVHRLGNLTLLTSKLNSSVSNGPWETKRAKLAAHDVFLLNRPLTALEVVSWNEDAIDARTSELIDCLLVTWPVPAGHLGKITEGGGASSITIELPQLVAAGALEPGARLFGRTSGGKMAEATIMANGHLEVDGKSFETPSGAARYVRGGGTNGWRFWVLDDGRQIHDLRNAFRRQLADGADVLRPNRE